MLVSHAVSFVGKSTRQTCGHQHGSTRTSQERRTAVMIDRCTSQVPAEGSSRLQYGHRRLLHGSEKLPQSKLPPIKRLSYLALSSLDGTKQTRVLRFPGRRCETEPVTVYNQRALIIGPNNGSTRSLPRHESRETHRRCCLSYR